MTMPANGGADRRTDSVLTALSSTPVPVGNMDANGTVPVPVNSNYGLRLSPKKDHKPENYEDFQSEFSPLLFSALERHLPPNLLNAPREVKFNHMLDILRRYWNEGERRRVKQHSLYRERIMSSYQPLYRELYELNPSSFFVPSFINAFMANDDVSRNQSIRNIMSEPVPGVLTFDMLLPDFCSKMLAEVENYEKWIMETKSATIRPNTMNKFGVVLDDFGMEPMLEKLIEDFIRDISKIFFIDVGGYALDSHHGFVVEYGVDRDLELGFHVDDSEVTLNVCLGKQFAGGELYFRGVRCEKHMHTESQPEEIFEYSHVPGRAVIHRGRHRHGARPTTAGNRVNLLIWCRSAVFRELRKHMNESTTRWCGECQREKRERLDRAVAEKKEELMWNRILRLR
ncbi:unnamed protein product [Lactuca saligna]|uniref:Fe2OG dioxygenase domain-containing protein n=1 Tax=Lactuca saligna TaxID=75948 RepID=A0AA35Y596_LACSI|nr:unnamed protein product [Lactuca saligna]